MKAPLLVGLVLTLAFAPAGETTVPRSGASSCPAAPLAVGQDGARRASAAALRREPRAGRPVVVGVRIAALDRSRGPQVRALCGRRTAARTVIVYVRRRAYLPAQSASQGLHFVSRFSNGFRVWFVAH